MGYKVHNIRGSLSWGSPQGRPQGKDLFCPWCQGALLGGWDGEAENRGQPTKGGFAGGFLCGQLRLSPEGAAGDGSCCPSPSRQLPGLKEVTLQLFRHWCVRGTSLAVRENRQTVESQAVLYSRISPRGYGREHHTTASRLLSTMSPLHVNMFCSKSTFPSPICSQVPQS